MKTLYLECNMGAAGDMLMAALLELSDNPQEFLARLNNIGIPGIVVSAEPSVKCGITGTHINVKINGQEEEALADCDEHAHNHHHDEHTHDGHHHDEHTHNEHHHEHHPDKHNHNEHHHEHQHPRL